MFENVLGQNASSQLILDIKAGALAPAMLFSGPPSSGKGTAALELGRVISCEEAAAFRADGAPPRFGRAAWDCACPSCSRHRFLVHPDLLCLGSRSFCAETAAAAAALKRDSGGSPAARTLFVRAVRKLLARFNPVLWEDDPKSGKVFPLVNSLEEDLAELDYLFTGQSSAGKKSAKESFPDKLIDGILKNTFKLESEGISDSIPIAQLRRAAWWSRLAPLGRGKLLVIENADLIQEEGRNSLLKILEEPPARVSIALTTSRQGTLPSTITSRLRVYRFAARGTEAEREVIRRVFRDTAEGAGLAAYLDSFLPVSSDVLEGTAAFFAASAAWKAAVLAKRRGRALGEEVVLLGKYCAPKAEAAGLGRPEGDPLKVVARVLEKAEKFEIRSLFSRFTASLLEQVSQSLRQTPSPLLPKPAYTELWKKFSLWASGAAGVYNLRPQQVLEKLFTDLSRGMAEL